MGIVCCVRGPKPESYAAHSIIPKLNVSITIVNLEMLDNQQRFVTFESLLPILMFHLEESVVLLIFAQAGRHQPECL